MEGKHDSFFLADKKQQKELKKSQNQYKGNKKVHFKNAVQPESTDILQNKRQEQFNSNWPGLEQEENKTVKKPFDKKTYRLKKYSKKYKLEQFEEQRKKKLLRNFYKEVQNEPNAGTYKVKGFDEEDSTDGQETTGRFVRHPDLISSVEDIQKVKKDPLAKAKERFNKIKQEKIDKQKEIERAKEERLQKLQEYKKKKQERFKKLSKKTKKGQPVMTGRLELLLEKIQKNK